MVPREKLEKILSKGFADKLDQVIIQSGSLIYTRRTMIEELGCGNFIAAANLNRVLKRLGIGTPKELYQTDPFSLLRSKFVGETAVYVAMCILDANGYSIEHWWMFKQDKDNVVKFSSYKHRAARRARNHKQEIA